MTVTNLSELREAWPKDDSGRVCRDLLLGYLTRKLLVTAAQNDCNPVSAQAESALNKAVSALILDIEQVMVKPTVVTPPQIHPLNRHQLQK